MKNRGTTRASGEKPSASQSSHLITTGHTPHQLPAPGEVIWKSANAVLKRAKREVVRRMKRMIWTMLDDVEEAKYDNNRDTLQWKRRLFDAFGMEIGQVEIDQC